MLLCVCTNIHKCVLVCACVCVCVCMCVCVCVCVCTRAHDMYVVVYVCVHAQVPVHFVCICSVCVLGRWGGEGVTVRPD